MGSQFARRARRRAKAARKEWRDNLRLVTAVGRGEENPSEWYAVVLFWFSCTEQERLVQPRPEREPEHQISIGPFESEAKADWELRHGVRETIAATVDELERRLDVVTAHKMIGGVHETRH